MRHAVTSLCAHVFDLSLELADVDSGRDPNIKIWNDLVHTNVQVDEVQRQQIMQINCYFSSMTAV